MTQHAINWLLPQYCLCCRQPTGHCLMLCQGCYNDLPWNQPQCHQCALPLPDMHSSTCGRCLLELTHYDTVIAPLRYQSPISNIISQFKFSSLISHRHLLSHLLLPHLNLSDTHPIQALIPVPMHPTRLRQRGYNQAYLLACALSTLTHIQVDDTLLRKTKLTTPQRQLNAKKRTQTIKNTFEVRPNNYRTVALIDDVMTTGSTINEASRQLKRSGIDTVDAWVIARA